MKLSDRSEKGFFRWKHLSGSDGNDGAGAGDDSKSGTPAQHSYENFPVIDNVNWKKMSGETDVAWICAKLNEKLDEKTMQAVGLAEYETSLP